MTDSNIEQRLESLETRIMHLDATIDELTRTLLDQEQLMNKQIEAIKHLEGQVQTLTSANPGVATDDPPPPHY